MSRSQCKVIAVGSRACGGPNAYKVYSVEHADSEKVKALAQKITHQERLFNAATGMMSICEHLSEPEAYCVSNTCSTTSGPALY